MGWLVNVSGIIFRISPYDPSQVGFLFPYAWCLVGINQVCFDRGEQEVYTNQIPTKYQYEGNIGGILVWRWGSSMGVLWEIPAPL